jgi:chromosome segregation ATPase
MKRPTPLVWVLWRATALRWASSLALLAVASSILLTGCSNCSDDPRGGGYLCGRQGLNSGRYQDRVDQKKTAVDNVTDDNLRKGQDVEDMKKKNADMNSQAQQISDDLFQLERETADLQKKIAAASTSANANKKELARLEREADQIGDQVALAQNFPGTNDERRQELERLQQKYKDLQSQILLLTGGI